MVDIKPFFHRDWYVSQVPEAADFAAGPLAHYQLFGWREQASPHPLFDVAWYLEQTPEQLEPDFEPLSHYLTAGWRDLRSPHPLFDPVWYLLQHRDLVARDLDPWAYYLQKGWQEGHQFHPLFDTEWYLTLQSDLDTGELEPLGHYLAHGWREGRNPHPLFAGEWYGRTYALEADVNPWLDYIQTGWRAGRNPHPRFEAHWYQETYLEPLLEHHDPLVHYLSEGWKEGLLPHPAAAKAPQAADKDDADTEDPLQQAAAPLYLELTVEARVAQAHRRARRAQEKSRSETDARLRADGTRGKILLVTHDTQLGGAQTVLRLFADWLQGSTRFSVGIVAIRDGHFRPSFEAIAPVFVLSDHTEEARAAALADWAGDDVTAVFVNSIASGSFYKYWQQSTPSVAFIHELPQILQQYGDEVDLVHRHSDHVICGGPDVYQALHSSFGFALDRLTSAYSYIEARPNTETEADHLMRRRAARVALGVSEERVLVMGCGVLHWRKSPDKFIETAQAVLNSGLDAEFVWLGGGPDEAACLAQATEAGIADRVRFTGYEPEVADKLAGADIFLLSSQEDPFPLVALYAAQAGAPIVCFQEAGGIADFVQTGSGMAVPFMDVDKMAEAVLAYGQDAALRDEAGAIGRAQVARQHTIAAVGPMLLDHLRQVAGLAPEISVIVPNYNYEAYLPQRLESIVQQTFQDFELILLDDASSDGSPALLEAFGSQRAATRVVLNQENSGSPFAQWLRGMEMAQAEILWLAEADDYCEPDLLSTLLPLFDDRNMRLASAMSVPVRADGSVIGDYSDLYLDRINPNRWRQDFVASDHEEANTGIGIANTIPNASAVLMRRFVPDAAFVDTVTKMRLCGDWFFYIRSMKGGNLGFSAAPLNYHRRHDTTVTHRLEGSQRYFDELAQVRAYVGQTYVQDETAQARIEQFFEQDITRFGITDRSTLPALVQARGKALPTLAVIAPDLSPGGGQVFAISLANEWQARGGRVVLVNAQSQPTHAAVLAKLNPEISLFHATDPGFDLADIVARFDVDVIHSSIWWADALVERYRSEMPVDMPWVVSMHGCHETFLKHPGIDHRFPEQLTRMLEQVDAWVYTAEKNLAVYEQYPRPETLLRIPNGMAVDPVREVYQAADLGLREEAVVLCLASRAIESKGWREAVRLTERLNQDGYCVDLMLIGEGPMADEIRAQAPQHVHLMGQVSNLQDYLAVADIGLLPSTFVGESLPLVLIEMLAKKLPLIASEVGEIASIVGTGEVAAGLMVPLLPDGTLDEEALLQAGCQLMEAETREMLKQRAGQRFEAEFRLERMVDSYAALYQQIMDGHKLAAQ